MDWADFWMWCLFGVGSGMVATAITEWKWRRKVRVFVQIRGGTPPGREAIMETTDRIIGKLERAVRRHPRSMYWRRQLEGMWMVRRAVESDNQVQIDAAIADQKELAAMEVD